MAIWGCAQKANAIPDHVLYIDGDTQAVLDDVPASKLSDAERFQTVADGGRVPIVKVVIQKMGTMRELHAYGPNGELLRSTIALSQ